MKDTDTTEVIFRKWKDNGDIIALFPYEARKRGFFGIVESYEHVGQHGDADYPLVVKATRPATPEEYADLKAELEGLGYNLKVMQRRQRR